MQLKKYDKLSFEKKQKIYKDFWISKRGYYPNKIEKVVLIVTLEQKSKASEEIYNEYQIFIQTYNDPIFTGKIK